MITSLRLKDFKNFADETLHIGQFTLIVGANASGKSNIRDAFRFLHGVGRGYSLAEIVGGKHEAGWEPIRGATNEFVRFQSGGKHSEVDRFSLEVEMKFDRRGLNFLELGDNIRYRIDVAPEDYGGGLSIADEELWADSKEIYTAEIIDHPGNLLDRSRPALWRAPHALRHVQHAAGALDEVLGKYSQADGRAATASGAAQQLDRMRFFGFKPDRMREPATPGQTTLGDSGEYLPTVLREICTDPKRESVLASWLRGLTPMDVASFEFPADPSGKIHLVIRETNGARVSANCASDGTLRFLAMLAALLGQDPLPYIYLFEEIENGLHASRLHLLIELIEQVTSDGTKQVIATTHSPNLLSLVRDATFESTSVVCRLEDANEAIIRPVAELPKARELRKTQGLGRLLAGGWMETALAFAEGSGEDEERSERRFLSFPRTFATTNTS